MTTLHGQRSLFGSEQSEVCLAHGKFSGDSDEVNECGLSFLPLFGHDDLCKFLLEHSKPLFGPKVRIKWCSKGPKNPQTNKQPNQTKPNKLLNIYIIRNSVEGTPPDADLYFMRRSAVVKQ